MWARAIEVMLGCWLALSPFIFRHPATDGRQWANDLACAALVIVLALLSLWPPFRRAHLMTLALALWLGGFGYYGATFSPSPALQNDLLVGLLLSMFALIPVEASLPPKAWRAFYAEGKRRSEHSQT